MDRSNVLHASVLPSIAGIDFSKNNAQGPNRNFPLYGRRDDGKRTGVISIFLCAIFL